MEDHQEDVNVKSIMGRYYQSGNGSIYYLFHNRGYQIGGGTSKDACSGMKFYSLP